MGKNSKKIQEIRNIVENTPSPQYTPQQHQKIGRGKQFKIELLHSQERLKALQYKTADIDQLQQHFQESKLRFEAVKMKKQPWDESEQHLVQLRHFENRFKEVDIS